MGTLPKDRSLTEDALKEYLAMFEAPLPQDTITALSQLFKTDCQLTPLADDALIELGGHCTSGLRRTDITGSPSDSTPPPPPTHTLPLPASVP